MVINRGDVITKALEFFLGLATNVFQSASQRTEPENANSRFAFPSAACSIKSDQFHALAFDVI
jgi:hypothetical protein